MVVTESSGGLRGGVQGREELRVLSRLWACAMRWVTGALHRGREGGKDQVGSSVGGNLEVYVEYNEFMANQVSGGSFSLDIWVWSSDDTKQKTTLGSH